MADYVYLVQLDIPEEHEEEFNRLYDTQHVPYLLTVPGVQGCTRYKLESSDVEGTARYAAIYEMDSADLPTTAAWKEQSDRGDWRIKVRPHITQESHAILKRIT